MITPVVRVSSSGGDSGQMQNYGTFKTVQHANERQEDFNGMMNANQQPSQNQIYYEVHEIDHIMKYIPPIIPLATSQFKSNGNKVTPLTQSETSKHINIRV